MASEVADHPLFFLSYAHKHSRPAPEIKDFFEELSGLVVEHAGLGVGEVPGFMDVSIPGGRQWDVEVLTALGTCKVLVPLLSPLYFRSEWCGREWDAFARRQTTSGATSERAILPVIWVPWGSKPVPQVVKRVQRFSPTSDAATAGKYHKDGVRGLHFLKEDGHQGYQTLLWRLAMRIVEIAETHEAEQLILERSMLINAFKEQDS